MDRGFGLLWQALVHYPRALPGHVKHETLAQILAHAILKLMSYKIYYVK